MIFRLFAAALAMLLLATPAPNAAAQTVDPARIEDALDRLQLDDQQRDDVRPILEAGALERLAILQEAGIEPGQKPSIRQLMSIRGPVSEVSARTEQELAAVLSPVQMELYRAMVEERRAAFRAQYF